MNEIESARGPLLSKPVESNAALKTLQSEYNTVVNQNTPVASLPNEVLTGIFEMWHASQATPRGFIPFSQRSEAIVSHVTKHWRHIALGTPRIWTRIFCASNQMRPDEMEAYLRRSKPVPIDLIVIDGRTEVLTENTGPDTRLILPHMNRCRDVSIFTHSPTNLFAQFVLLAKLKAPFLQSLELSCRNPQDASDPISPPDVLTGGAPLLTAVRVYGTALPRCLPMNTLQIITTMSLSNISCGSGNECILNHTPNLSKLRLESLTLGSEIRPSMPLIVLPYLLLFAVNLERERDDGVISTLLNALSAPSLETLFLIEVEERDITEPLSPAKFPALRLLVIDSDDLEQAVIKLAVCCPYVTHLKCSSASVMFLQMVLEASEADSNVFTPTYWPNLQTLTLPAFLNGRCVPVSMLTARTEAGGCLQELFVDCQSEEALERLELNAHLEVYECGSYEDEFYYPCSWSHLNSG